MSRLPVPRLTPGTKSFLASLRALRWQLEGTPVHVFEVIPPLVDTRMTAGRGSGKITPQALVDELWPAPSPATRR